MTEITVFRTKYAAGWPKRHEGERAYVLELGKALERPYTSDAHFAAYRTPNARRLTREAIDAGAAVTMTAVVFDVDCPDTHGSSEPAPEQWRRELREHVQALAAVHPDPYYYETRGGSRLVYRLAEPLTLTTQEAAREWSQSYAVAIAYLARTFQIAADPACGDWQRLYRLPRATREPGGRSENRPTWGNADAIGSLCIDATPSDVTRARTLTKAFKGRGITEITPCASTGEGLFYHLLDARGDIVREHERRVFVIRCPRESDHSTGRTGDGSTLLYLPASGTEIGAIHCLHAHCSGMGAAEWLRLFSPSDKDRARERAGIHQRKPRAA